MLRINHKKGGIARDYRDSYLELVRLLTETAGIEHSLMKTYLYGLFSVKKKYHKVRGDIKKYSFKEHSPAGRGGTAVLRKKDNILDVALEEMQHLGLVNRFLASLGAAPNFIPHIFPYSSDVYPFSLELRSLDRYAAATYLWIEADECALSIAPKCKSKSEPKKFIEEVFAVLKAGSPDFKLKFGSAKGLLNVPNHVGSVYHAIIDATKQLAASPPPFLPINFPWGEWIQKMNWIVEQGEIAHYRLFRSIFSGVAFDSACNVWALSPEHPDYPSKHFETQTAYTCREHTIKKEPARRLAWLANLHYWLILALLDSAYRSTDLRLIYKAIDNMTLALWQLGDWLAEKYSTGVPFDQFGPQYMLGRTPKDSIPIIRALVLEAQNYAEELDKDGLLPRNYDLQIFEITLAGLRPGLDDPDAPRSPES
jgi:hypothetical protein